MRGKVKLFKNDRGYGFIVGQDGQDYFIHQSAIAMDGFRTLREGQPVEFDIEESSRGPKAINVCPGPVPEQSRSFRETVIEKSAR